eukprot:11764586-Alexandrium_andersonii.AAC.1
MAADPSGVAQRLTAVSEAKVSGCLEERARCRCLGGERQQCARMGDKLVCDSVVANAEVGLGEGAVMANESESGWRGNG